MKTLTVRLPEPLVAEIDAESSERGVSRSDVVRERLTRPGGPAPEHATLSGIADLIGSVDGLPADVSARRKHYLRATGYGRNRPR
jgi:hypothetical protein